MAANAKPVPEGFNTITVHLSVREASRAIEFYKNALGAQVLGVHHAPDGKVIHALLKIGDSLLMLADEFPGRGTPSPQTLGGSPVVLNVYVEDVDKLWQQAVTAGATVTMPLGDQFWGDRYGQVRDPFGHNWSLASRKEDITPAEMERRSKEVFAQMAAKGVGQS